MEKYIAIIKVLNNRGSLTEEQIMSNADLSLISPKEYLNFLINLELIAEKKLLTKTTYASHTQRTKTMFIFQIK